MVCDEVPFPPAELAGRVGRRHANELDGYDEVGRAMRDEIVGVLPSGWAFTGKRVLDFGCGAGRTLRHFVRDAEVAAISGCDIDGASIAWLQENLSPPFHVFECGELPPLALDVESLDLVWAISVFTHLADHWAAWLLELHRVLRPDGLLIATFMGRGMSEAIAREPWLEERIGMNVLYYGQPWEHGGPMVLHSPWWLSEHWARAFEIVSIREDGFVPSSGSGGQGIVLLRKRSGTFGVADLERVDPAEPREFLALQHNIRQLHRESLAARDAYGRAQNDLAAVRSPGD